MAAALAAAGGPVDLVEEPAEVTQQQALARPVQVAVGTKMRSVIKQADEAGIKDIVIQQFEIGQQIISEDLVPILEPELIFTARKREKRSSYSKQAILEKLNELPGHSSSCSSLRCRNRTTFTPSLSNIPRLCRVVALSGGYSREEANNRLRKQHGVVASFSRALVEGLTAQQSDAEFNAVLDKSIQSIFDASNT